MRGKLIRRRKLPAALTIGPDEIRVAKAALRARPVLLPPRPQIATCKAQKHRPATRLNPLALKRQEAFLDRIPSTACGSGRVGPSERRSASGRWSTRRTRAG